MVKKPAQKSGKKQPSPKPAKKIAASSNNEPAPEAKVPPAAAARPVANEQIPERSGAIGLIWKLALLAVIIGGGYGTLPLWKAYIPGVANIAGDDKNVKPASDQEQERAALNATLKVLIERVGSIEEQVADVRKLVAATALPDEVAIANKSLQLLSGRLAKIEESNVAVGTVLNRLSRLEQDLAVAAKEAAEPPSEMTAAIGEISKRLETLETEGASSTRQSIQHTNAQALVLAVGQLRQILPAGQPYALELQTLTRLGGDDPEILRLAGELREHAAAGVPSLQALTRSYARIAENIDGDTAISGQGFFEQTLNRLKSLIRVRRVDDAADGAGSAESLTANAGQALADGELQAAVEILQAVANSSAPVKEWIRQAQIRIAAERALALLNVYAVSKLAPAE